jgi:hypothetical protein
MIIAKLFKAQGNYSLKKSRGHVQKRPRRLLRGRTGSVSKADRGAYARSIQSCTMAVPTHCSISVKDSTGNG